MGRIKPLRTEQYIEEERERMTEAAKEARRQYKREWNKRNRDKVRESQRRYWERKAAAQQETDTTQEDSTAP